MEIPYNVSARPDTGLYNSKLGIWLFLASEVMLFGGLFSAYVFLRLGAEPGYWPHGLLNVPVGTANTFVLIASSVTVVMAWAALKMRQFNKYKIYMAITILCGLLFLIVKLAYEWPDKFNHFGVFIKKDALAKYEQYLGNEHLASKKMEPRYEISGHLLDAPKGSPYEEHARKNAEHFEHEHHAAAGHEAAGHGAETPVVRTDDPNDFVIQLDAVNADPTSPENDKQHFWPRPRSEKTAVISAADIDGASAFVPRHSSYFSSYFLITGLHGLHVLGGIIVFLYFWLPIPGGANLYKRNPEHLANRVEVAGLFWHFVDLVWIFVFPIFYLL
ncbi:cytochrome c oxidase subunit 3 [Verrucomicrobiota bacterium sgz303538]